MVKNFFLAFLIILVLVAIYSINQKKNSTVNKIFNLPKEETNQPTGTVNQPTLATQQPSGGSNAVFLEINQPANNSIVADAVVPLTGKTIPNSSVFVNDQELKSDVNGNFSASVTLNEGQNDIIVVASDDLGNSVEKDITVNLESTQ